MASHGPALKSALILFDMGQGCGRFVYGFLFGRRWPHAGWRHTLYRARWRFSRRYCLYFADKGILFGRAWALRYIYFAGEARFAGISLLLPFASRHFLYSYTVYAMRYFMRIFYLYGHSYADRGRGSARHASMMA